MEDVEDSGRQWKTWETVGDNEIVEKEGDRGTRETVGTVGDGWRQRETVGNSRRQWETVEDVGVSGRRGRQ